MRNFINRLIVIKNDLDIKLGFMNWHFYNLIILIKIQKFRQSCIAFEKLGI